MRRQDMENKAHIFTRINVDDVLYSNMAGCCCSSSFLLFLFFFLVCDQPHIAKKKKEKEGDTKNPQNCTMWKIYGLLKCGRGRGSQIMCFGNSLHQNHHFVVPGVVNNQHPWWITAIRGRMRNGLGE